MAAVQDKAFDLVVSLCLFQTDLYPKAICFSFLTEILEMVSGGIGCERCGHPVSKGTRAAYLGAVTPRSSSRQSELKRQC